MFRSMKRHPLLALIVASLFNVGPAKANFLPISVPDVAYTSRTSLIPIVSGASRISDGRLTVKFINVRFWPGFSEQALRMDIWNDGWGILPWVESTSTSSLGQTSFAYEGTILLSFSSPIKTFGLEARPGISSDAPRDQLVSAWFAKGGRLYPSSFADASEFAAPTEGVGNIERRVYEAEGALLFAASTTTEYFTQVMIDFRDAGWIARLRYSVGEPPAPTHADFFTTRNGVRTDQVTMNVGETLPLTYLVKFRNTGEFLDVTQNQNTHIFTDPPRGRYQWGGWQATEETRNKIFPLYARYYEPYTGQSITDTIRVYVRP